MPRIQNPGIAYSVIDTDYTRKELAIKIRVKFGLIGHLVLFEVINWINEGKGCYAEYTEGTAATFAMTRLGSLEHAEKVDEIFRFMLEIGFFDEGAFRRDRILTSEGIVKRWALAKRRPESYDLPDSIREIMKNAEIGQEQKNSQKEHNSDQKEHNSSQKEHKPDQKEHKGKERKGKEYIKYKQTNKQTNSEVSENETKTEIDTQRENPRWGEVREKVARMIYEPGLSADLTDAITAAAVRQWINVPQLRAWIRKARDELEVSRRTDHRQGKARIWATLRPLIEEVYLAHGMTLPKCNPKRREPPPAPENANGEQGQTAAGRAVVPR